MKAFPSAAPLCELMLTHTLLHLVSNHFHQAAAYPREVTWVASALRVVAEDRAPPPGHPLLLQKPSGNLIGSLCLNIPDSLSSLPDVLARGSESGMGNKGAVPQVQISSVVFGAVADFMTIEQVK